MLAFANTLSSLAVSLTLTVCLIPCSSSPSRLYAAEAVLTWPKRVRLKPASQESLQEVTPEEVLVISLGTSVQTVPGMMSENEVRILSR